jgi:hypothetical protein
VTKKGGGGMFVSNGQFLLLIIPRLLVFGLIYANFMLVSYSSAVLFWAR